MQTHKWRGPAHAGCQTPLGKSFLGWDLKQTEGYLWGLQRTFSHPRVYIMSLT
jgi:hypothetical protein